MTTDHLVGGRAYYRVVRLSFWSFERKTYTWWSPKGHIHEIQWISCEIKRHSLPPALHKTEEFLLSYLIYKVFRWISWNPPDFERPIARNGNAYVLFVRLHHPPTLIMENQKKKKKKKSWLNVKFLCVYCKLTLVFLSPESKCGVKCNTINLHKKCSPKSSDLCVWHIFHDTVYSMFGVFDDDEANPNSRNIK